MWVVGQVSTQFVAGLQAVLVCAAKGKRDIHQAPKVLLSTSVHNISITCMNDIQHVYFVVNVCTCAYNQWADEVT